MHLYKYRKPNGGFEITIKAAVFLFQKVIQVGVLKSPFLRIWRYLRRYRREIFVSTIFDYQ